METLAVEGLSGLTILAVALAVWFLTGKATRASIGDSVKEGALTVEQSLYLGRITSFKEAEDEIGDLLELGKRANKLLAEKNKKA